MKQLPNFFCVDWCRVWGTVIAHLPLALICWLPCWHGQPLDSLPLHSLPLQLSLEPLSSSESWAKCMFDSIVAGSGFSDGTPPSLNLEAFWKTYVGCNLSIDSLFMLWVLLCPCALPLRSHLHLHFQSPCPAGTAGPVLPDCAFRTSLTRLFNKLPKWFSAHHKSPIIQHSWLWWWFFSLIEHWLISGTEIGNPIQE